MATAVKFENMKKNLIEHISMNKINNFQQFQINLGISEGGFGLKSHHHTCIAANLASKLEFLRHFVRTKVSQRIQPNQWITTNMQPNNQDKYIKNILSASQIFWERHGDPTRRTLEYSWKEKSQQVLLSRVQMIVTFDREV
jgi:hypothetical protein